MQMDYVTKMFCYFEKPDDVLAKCKTGSHFLNLNLREVNLLPKELIFVGSKAQKLIEKLGLNHVNVKNFLEKVKKVFYIAIGLYIKKTVIRKLIADIIHINQSTVSCIF